MAIRRPSQRHPDPHSTTATETVLLMKGDKERGPATWSCEMSGWWIYGLKEKDPGKLGLGGTRVIGRKERPALGSSLNKTIAGCDSGSGVFAMKLGDSG